MLDTTEVYNGVMWHEAFLICRTWHLDADRVSPILARLCDSGGAQEPALEFLNHLAMSARKEAAKEAPAAELLNHLAVSTKKRG